MMEIYEKTLQQNAAGVANVMTHFHTPLNGTQANLKIREDGVSRAIRLSTSPIAKSKYNR